MSNDEQRLSEGILGRTGKGPQWPDGGTVSQEPRNASPAGENPLVSVIIPTYKQWVAVARAVDSVLCQTYTPLEVVVVDDNGQDSEGAALTESTMQRYAGDERVKYIRHERNMERSAARNTGIRNCHGEYIMFLDSDDQFLKDKVAAQVACLDSRGSSWGACYSGYVRKRNGKVVCLSGETREGCLLRQVLGRNLFIHAGSNLMVRRRVLEDVGLFDESMSANEDIEFLARVLEKYKIAFADTLGLVVNMHPKGPVDLKAVTDVYLGKVSRQLFGLCDSERASVLNMLNLQVFVHVLLSRTGTGAALRTLFERKVRLDTVVRYLAHLVWRRVIRRSYGFRM